jgi:hypothetical protein
MHRAVRCSDCGVTHAVMFACGEYATDTCSLCGSALEGVPVNPVYHERMAAALSFLGLAKEAVKEANRAYNAAMRGNA